MPGSSPGGVGWSLRGQATGEKGNAFLPRGISIRYVWGYDGEKVTDTSALNT